MKDDKDLDRQTAEHIAHIWKLKTGETNLLGSVAKNMEDLLPTIVEVFEEKDIMAKKRKLKPIAQSEKVIYRIKNYNRRERRFLNHTEIFDLICVDRVAETIRMQYAHLPEAMINSIIDSTPPDEQLGDLYELFVGSNVVVHLGAPIVQRKRTNFTYPY